MTSSQAIDLLQQRIRALFETSRGERRLDPDDPDLSPAGPGVVIVARDLGAVVDGKRHWAPVEVLCVDGEMVTLAREALAAREMGSDDSFFAWLVPVPDAAQRRAATDELAAAMARADRGR